MSKDHARMVFYTQQQIVEDAMRLLPHGIPSNEDTYCKLYSYIVKHPETVAKWRTAGRPTARPRAMRREANCAMCLTRTACISPC